ncbi:MAG: IclR family transcriptional regulator [Arthrobacter sp.]|uniref:IclR family transcriptional regulator n=1 Tax=unclassified Arthrobacter TaxID=235627 RepID=UPI002654F187|nr:IclR family transcriptional regulator [Micrococcaceae bacterium]MDN5812811.1 IclR family transcriptional regulator [Micrococcaceae bacterium]MDN5825101.1 IclR family transcriptional regulator [Micrococcaceae bacterium]MDN5879264.1 IclR family transcriptional regulator [Micrococcaceae bacterium]MDN5886020.1 IclR family transcriptional regulator [Micrococcaceae bacterium]
MAEPSTRTVERALHLLGSVCDAGHLSLAEAARQTGLSASTALRLLRTLESSGFVRREPEAGYRPGMRIVQLGAQALSHESLVSLAMESLRHLVAATGESAYLSVPSVGGTAARHSIYIAVEEGTHSVRHTSWVGRSVPLDNSAVGAVLRGRTPAAGYVVVDRGVEKDVTAIAAPITVGRGDETRVIAALSVIAPSYRMDPELVTRIGRQVAAEAHSILTTHQLDTEAGDDADSKEQTA